MAKIIKIPLTSQGIRTWSNQIDEWNRRIKIAGQNTVNDMAELAREQMELNYHSQDLESSSSMSFEIEGNENEKTVKMVGTQAIYHEFGTGTEGQESPHPIKDKFDLNEYNSGPTIRKANKYVEKISGIPKGELYWTYTNDNGEMVFTQGIPAQKTVYNAIKVVRKELPRIAEKRWKEALE